MTNEKCRTKARVPLLALAIITSMAMVGATATANHPEEIPCHEEIQALPLSNEDIVVTWTEVEEADHYQVLRIAGGDRDTLEVFITEDPEYHDTNTTAGETYRYSVTPSLERGERFTTEGDCPTAEATAIPFFNGTLLAALGAIASLGAYAALTRRT